MTKIPRFLQVTTDTKSLSERPSLEIDDLVEGGNALDTVPLRPGYRKRALKKVKRRIAELEQMRNFLDHKKAEAISKEDLEKLFDIGRIRETY